VTAHDILEELIRIRPDFRRYWEGENYHLGDDGSFSECGVFGQFTNFFREQHRAMTKSELKFVAELINQCEKDEFLAEAAYTCFLENIAGDPPDQTLAPFLSPAAREFMRNWRHHRG
jgi:hypothetical protein